MTMKRRNRLTALAALTFAGAAVTGGAVVSGSAMASSAPPETITASALFPDPSGEGSVSCTMTEMPAPAAHPIDPEARAWAVDGVDVPDHLVPDDVDAHGLPVREGSPEECAKFEDDVVFGKMGSHNND